jgi:hypothetical protein
MIRFTTKSTPAPRPVIKPVMRSIAERMADDMNELAFAGRAVSAETLRERGYTDPVIKRIAPEATQIARRNAVRHVACG